MIPFNLNSVRSISSLPTDPLALARVTPDPLNPFDICCPKLGPSLKANAKDLLVDSTLQDLSKYNSRLVGGPSDRQRGLLHTSLPPLFHGDEDRG